MERVGVLLLVFTLLSPVFSYSACKSHSDCEAHEQCLLSGTSQLTSDGICFAPPGAQALSALELASASSHSQGGSGTVTSLAIKAPEGFESSIVLGSPKEKAFSIGVTKDKSFAIQQADNKYVVINKDGNIAFRTNKLAAASFDVKDSFLVGLVRQWALAVNELFDSANAVSGWAAEPSKPVVKIAGSTCAGITMLGGYELFSGGSVGKTFSSLNKHTQVRVEATFHFIDFWNGETGFMQINNGLAGELEYAWTASYAPADSIGPSNVCGDPKYGEGQFSNTIDITIPHTKDSIKLVFGSTLDSAAAAFWGVSNLNIYLR